MRREGGERGHSARCAPFASADHSFGETGRLAAPFVATAARSVIDERTKFPFPAIHKRAKLQLAEGARRGAVAQHDERRCKTIRATRFRRAALFAERLAGTGKKVKGREIDVAPCFCTGPCASKAANHWQASAPRRAPEAPRWRRVRDSNPRRTCILNGFQDRRVQPLRQLSMSSSSPRSFRCAPLARRLAKSFFLASPRMLMVRSPFAALHSLGDSPNLFFSLRPVCSWSARLSLRSTRSETRQIFFSRFAPYAHGPLALRCAPLARRLAKSFFLASPRMLMVRSPCAALHSLGDSPNLTIRQSLNLSIRQSVNLSISQSLNPSISQSVNLSISQSVNHFFFARAGFTGVVFTSSTIFAVTSGFALR